MAWVIVGLGNPGEEYANTRHNAGRMALEYAAKAAHFKPWNEDKKTKARVSGGVLERNVVAFVLPDTFMNHSGDAVRKFVKSQKEAEKLVVVYDDLDLPLGAMKISYDRGSGGHKGLESIIAAVKTKKFTRVRIGVSPATSSGQLRKPEGKKDVVDFILHKFKPSETEELKKLYKKVTRALATIIVEGRERAMNEFN